MVHVRKTYGTSGARALGYASTRKQERHEVRFTPPGSQLKRGKRRCLKKEIRQHRTGGVGRRKLIRWDKPQQSAGTRARALYRGRRERKRVVGGTLRKGCKGRTPLLLITLTRSRGTMACAVNSPSMVAGDPCWGAPQQRSPG